MIIRENFDISDISYIKVGGIVKKLYEIDKISELFLLDNNFICIGNTSKILFAFNYLNKNIVKFKMNKIVYFNDSYFIYSGATLSQIYNFLLEKNISGFEYIATIPGMLGGSIVNNASFLSQSISDNLIKILVFDKNNFRWINKIDCKFAYRKSCLNKEDFIIVGAMFKIVKKDKKELIKSRKYADTYRLYHQNEYKNTLGSTFKNQDRLVIGKLLDELGFKGFRYSNNVKISQNHANFILVNNKTHYLEIYTFIDLLKWLLYYYLKKNISLEINVITEDGKQRDN